MFGIKGQPARDAFYFYHILRIVVMHAKPLVLSTKTNRLLMGGFDFQSGIN